MIPDQKLIWNKKHSDDEHESFRDSHSPFAKLTNEYLGPNSYVLELGCGNGRDSDFFAKNGHKVLATDFSEVAIEKDKAYFSDSKIDFKALDMQKPLSYGNEEFDAVYAHLSLHYYDDETTRKIVKEVHRVLKSGGVFAFACKSINDFHYGNGEEVEENIFISETGHVRHLFSIAYAKGILSDLFDIAFLKEDEEIHWGEKSVMIKCIAKKT